MMRESGKLRTFLKNLPSAEMYFRSYMHKDAVQYVTAANRSDFFLSFSVDGVAKFWHRTESDIEFVKRINPRNGSYTSFSVSHDGRYVATGSRTGKVAVFGVVSLDLVSCFDFGAAKEVCVTFVHDPEVPVYQLAVVVDGGPSILVCNALECLEMGEVRPKIMKQLDDIHRSPIVCMTAIPRCKCVVSCDKDGLIEFWKSDGTTPEFEYRMKIDTNLFELARLVVQPVSCFVSKNGRYLGICCGDWATRVFDVETGKLVLTVKDDITGYDRFGLGQKDYDERVALEKQYRTSCSFFSAVFDETSSILVLPSPFGLKFIAVDTGELLRIIGRVEQQRFSSAAIMQCGSPMALVSSWADNRVYLFTTNPPESAKRDIINEHEEKETVNQTQSKVVKPVQSEWPKAATLHTTMGGIKFEMFVDQCPLAVENFVTLARRGYYDNIRVHRVVRDFCVQTGDPTGTGCGGESIWGKPFEDEFPLNAHSFGEAGMVGMANSGPNTNVSQFFVTTAPATHLDNKHTCWGKVVSGMDNIRQIELAPVDQYHHPVSEIKLVNITFHYRNRHRRLGKLVMVFPKLSLGNCRRTNALFRRGRITRLLTILVIVIVILTLLPLFLPSGSGDDNQSVNYSLYKAPNNSFYEVVVPPPFNRPESRDFKYGEMMKPFIDGKVENGTCIDRKSARNEFVRVLGKNLRSEDLQDPQVLVIGAATSLGVAITRTLSEKGVRFIGIEGINEVDFSSPDALIPFDSVALSKVFIAYQPHLWHHSTTDGSHYLNGIATKYIAGLTSFLAGRSIPFVLAPTGPMNENVVEHALKNGGTVVEIPYMIDSRAFHDLENPMMRAVRECRKAGRSIIEVAPDSFVHSVTAHEMSKFVRRQIKDDDDIRRGRFGVVGASHITVKEAVNIALETTGYSDCDVTFKEFPHTIVRLPPPTQQALAGADDGNVKQMVKDAFKEFTRPEKGSPYFSIVLCGRHDNFSKGFEVRAQNQLDAINEHLEKVPLADIEIVFVDYATPIRKKPLLHTVLKLGKNLVGKVRYIIVPEESHAQLLKRMGGKISFLEYVAKNIGVRRSKGKFVLTTNPDDLLSVVMFELIAERQFNTALLYRATRWDNRPNTTQTIPELWQGLSERWEMRNWDINQRCTPKSNAFIVIDSVAACNGRPYACGVGDFVLLSKKMWDAVEGFNEFPANPNVDTVFMFRMMKFVHGYVQMTMYPLILHQRHVKKNIFRPSVDAMTEYMNEYCCTGRCTGCGKFAETRDWGLANEEFREIAQ